MKAIYIVRVEEQSCAWAADAGKIGKRQASVKMFSFLRPTAPEKSNFLSVIEKKIPDDALQGKLKRLARDFKTDGSK